MLKINHTNIELTRADSAYITISITDEKGAPIELTSQDKVRCQVREEADGGNLLFDGRVIRKGDDILWYISPEDTEGVEATDYVWDAQVEFSNGDVFTFVPLSRFRVLSEVTEVD